MNKVIYTRKYETPIPVKDFKIKNILSYSHVQDCCESVYVDFEHLDCFRKQIDDLQEIHGMEIKVVEGEGIVIFLYPEYQPRLGIFLACRNEQNGYYSDELTLNIQQIGETNVAIDLRECQAVADYIR